MDVDIRELVIEEDLFDPLADDEEETESFEDARGIGIALDAGDAPVGEEAPPQDGDEAGEGAPKKDERPARERIEELFSEMPGQKRLLIRLVDYCRNERSGEEMDAYTLELKKYCFSVYTPVIYRELLEKAGAIRYLPADDAASAEAGDGAPSETASGQSGKTAAAEASFGAAGSPSRGAVPSAAPIESAFALDEEDRDGGDLDGMDFSRETYLENGQEVEIDFLEVEQTRPGNWVATEEGLAIVDEQDDVAAVRNLVGKEPRYESIYERILEFCKQEKLGRSSKEIDACVNDDPLLEEPRRYSGYFVGRLERAGALEWRSGWVVTEAGEAILEELAVKHG